MESSDCAWRTTGAAHGDELGLLVGGELGLLLGEAELLGDDDGLAAGPGGDGGGLAVNGTRNGARFVELLE